MCDSFTACFHDSLHVLAIAAGAMLPFAIVLAIFAYILWKCVKRLA